MTMRLWLGNVVTVLVVILVNPVWAQSAAEDFKMGCAACHTIGGGKIIGPDLAGIHQRRPAEWLVRFVVSSQSLVQEGDPEAKKIFAEFNGLVMPDAPFPEARVEAVLSYIASRGEKAATSGAGESAMKPDADNEQITFTDRQIETGQGLFEGSIRLSSGGAACNSCHGLGSDRIIGGGSLAKTLSGTFDTLGAAGIKAILERAPFPVMQAAYAERPLTEEEVNALTGFLQHVGVDGQDQKVTDYGFVMVSGGIAGSTAVFALCGLFWRGRKKTSVNQAIYDRQVKSQ